MTANIIWHNSLINWRRSEEEPRFFPTRITAGPPSPASWIALAGFVLLFAWVVSLHWRTALTVGGGELADCDPPAHFTSGAMVYDYLRTALGTDPNRFAEGYYVRYPKVAIGHWPPVYYAVQTIWYFLFGLSVWSAQWLSVATAAGLAWLGLAFIPALAHHHRKSRCHLSLAARLFSELGCFDTATLRPSSEVRELCGRWQAGGGKLAYLLGARVYHYHALGAASFIMQHFAYGRGACRLRLAREKRGLPPLPGDPEWILASLTRYPFAEGDTGMALALAGLAFCTHAANVAGYAYERAFGAALG